MRRRRWLPRKAFAAEERKEIARERIDILKELIKKNPESPHINKYKKIIDNIIKKYRPFGIWRRNRRR